MGYNAYAALFGLLVLCASAFAGLGDYGTDYPEYDTGFKGAAELNYAKCDVGGYDTQAYCDAYCEYETYEECFYVSHITSSTPGTIDQCVCTCGVSQETVIYNNVPCLDDLTRYGSPTESSYDDYGGSACCLPMFLLIGVAAGAVWRRE